MSIDKYIYTNIDDDLMENSTKFNLPLYGIVSADYLDYQDMPFIQMSTTVIEEFKQKLVDWYKKSSNPLEPKLPDNYVVKDEQILILWKNVPLRDDLDTYNQQLIYTFCKKNFSETYTGFNYRLYIDSLDTLAMGNLNTLAQQLHIINSIGNNKPFFMCNDAIFTYSLEQLKLEQENNEELDVFDVVTANSYFFNHLIETLRYFLVATNQMPNPDSLCSKFIDCYFKWQLGTETVRSACDILRNPKNPDKAMSKSVFYSMVESFEKTPVFAEFLKLYPELHDVPKTGITPDILDFMEYYNNTVKDENDIAGKLVVCEKYNFVSLIDLNRNYLSYKKKSESTRRHKIL